MKKSKNLLISFLAGVTALSMLAGCGASPFSAKPQAPSDSASSSEPASSGPAPETAPPEDDDETRSYSLVVSMPRYDRMWFGGIIPPGAT